MLELQGFGSLPMNRTPEPELMEGLETAIVTKLGYANPYLITQDA